MSSKEISLVCKIKNHRGQVNRPERVNQGTCPCDPLIIERNRNIFWISFVVSENIRTFESCCLSVTWDWRKDGTKLLIAQFPDELQHRKGKTSKHCHIGVGALCANFNICGNGLLQTCLGIWWGLRFLYTHIVSADLPIMRKVKQLIIPNF